MFTMLNIASKSALEKCAKQQLFVFRSCRRRRRSRCHCRPEGGTRVLDV